MTFCPYSSGIKGNLYPQLQWLFIRVLPWGTYEIKHWDWLPPSGNKCPKWQCWIPKEMLDHSFFFSPSSSRSFFSYERQNNMKILEPRDKHQRPEWWLTAVISALRKPRQEKRIVSSPRQAWGQPATGWESILKTKKVREKRDMPQKANSWHCSNVNQTFVLPFEVHESH